MNCPLLCFLLRHRVHVYLCNRIVRIHRIRVPVSDFTRLYVSYVYNVCMCVCAICFDAVRDFARPGSGSAPENRYARYSSIIGLLSRESGRRDRFRTTFANYLLRSRLEIHDLARGILVYRLMQSSPDGINDRFRWRFGDFLPPPSLLSR